MFFFFNDYKNELLEAYEIPHIRELAESDVFYYQKAKTKFDEFSKYDISSIVIPSLLAGTKQTSFSFERWLNSYNEESAEYKLLLLIGQVVSYFDTNAAMKNKLNEYEDKRVLAKAMVRQDKWVKWLLEFKAGADINTFPGNIRNAILFIQNPESNINIISEDYRKTITERLFNGENPNLFAEMKNLGISAKNPLNNGVLYTWILYSDSIKEMWLESKEINSIYSKARKPMVGATWFEPIINALKELGGSATRKEAHDKIIEMYNLTDDDLSLTRDSSGVVKVLNDIDWARQNLVYAGYIDNSEHGKWKLTEKGSNSPMNIEIASEIVRHINASRSIVRKSDIRYWIYTPGEQARFWNDFYNEGIMGIGWDEVGDLSDYNSKGDIKTAIQELSQDDKSHKNDTHALWEFANKISIGDVVIVKKGYSLVLGRGIVESEYIFDDERVEYKHIRKVNWTHFGEWEHPGQAVQKTLTDITSYTDYVEKLEALFRDEGELFEVNDKPEINYDEYTEQDFLNDVYISEKRYNTLKGLLLRKKNIILQGAPGVGKTFAAKRLAFSIMEKEDTSRVKVVQFHQSYSYEDFIMGWRPDGSGFKLEEGPFYKFCKIAEVDDENEPYFFIIDEINRGNLSKIFGELLMLIEGDKRGDSIKLLYKDEQFSVPKNVHIIGMMNTADRSLAMIDYALRRRFAFFDLAPAFQSDGFKKYQSNIGNTKFNNLVATIERLNADIGKDASLGEGFRIGHSYFCVDEDTIIDDDWLSDVVEYEIIPLLNEYWFDEPSKTDNWARQLRGAING